MNAEEIVTDIAENERLSEVVADAFGELRVDMDLVQLEYDVDRSTAKKVKKLLNRRREHGT